MDNKAAPTCDECGHVGPLGPDTRCTKCGNKCVFPAAPTDEATYRSPDEEHLHRGITEKRWPSTDEAVATTGDDYVAWCRYTNSGEGWTATIVTCDSDAEGAFKVYRAAPTARADEEKVAREIVKEVVWPTDRSLPSEHCACESSMCEHWQAELANLIVSALTAARGTAAGIKLAEAWEVRAKKLQSEFVDAHSREDGGSMLGAADALWACAKQLRDLNGPAAERWRPIETAPKDQKYILGGWWYNSQMWVWDRCEYFEGWFCPNGGTPTHWMPLPSGPQANQEEGKQ